MKEENLLRDYCIKAGASIYMVALTIFLSYYIAKIYEEDIWMTELWDNERIAVIAFITIGFVVSLIYFITTEKNIIATMFLYHAILIGTVACIFMDLENMPFVLVPMIIAAICGKRAGMVSAVSIGCVMLVGFSSYPEYIFASAIPVMCVVSCFAVWQKNKIVANIAGTAVYLVMEFLYVMFFKHYCNETGYVYETSGFVVWSMVTAVICIVVANIAGMLLKIVLHKETPDFYLRKISSEEYVAVGVMKRKSAPLYYHSIEVAELAKVAAKRIGANQDLAYAGGIYHDFGKLAGQEYIKEGLILAEKYNIPKSVRAIMVEHNIKSRLPRTKEAAIVMLCDTAVSAVEYLKGTMDKKDMSEKTIVENALNKRITSGALHRSGMTIEEFDIVKEVLVKVKERQ